MKLEEIFKLEEITSQIDELKSGRETSLPKAEKYLKELEPEEHDVMDRTKRKDKWVKVDLAEGVDEDGNAVTIQVNDGLGEKTAMRPEPVARIALALQKLIVKRAVAFTFGNPVILNAEPEENSKEEDVLKAVKRVLFDSKSRTINRKIARAIYSSTEAAEFWYPVDKQHNNYGFESKYKLRTAIFSPAFGDTLYPYFDETGDLIAFSREYLIEQEDKKDDVLYFETYTATEIHKWRSDKSTSNQWVQEESYPRINTIGKIPIVYGAQPEVEWADVQNLIDRLEKLLSNFADTNDYHASPKIFTTGDIRGWAKKGESGAIIEGEDGATAEYLSWAQAPEAVKLEIETLLRMIYTITQTPDISFDSVKGLGNISGVALKLLFMDAHLKVQEKMEIFDDYLQRRLSVIQAYLKQLNAKDAPFAIACDSLTIEPEIEPYMLDDEAAQVNTLLAATGQKAIASRKTAVQQLGWVNDTDAEIEQIQQEENPGLVADLFEPTI